MKETLKLTVKDILDRPPFTEAICVAGHVGLDHTVRWVHILEIAEIDELVSGNELILTTGVGWTQSKESRQSFLAQLIDRKVSGLAIELGTTLKEVPEDLILLAEDAHFPLIIFNKKVRFIDITQDLNGLLLNNQYKMMADLEAYANKLNHLLLTTGAFNGILQFLHDYLNVQVVYKPVQGHMICVPPITDEEVLNQLKVNGASAITDFLGDNIALISQSVQALGFRFADLFIYGKRDGLTEYDSLVLDRTSIALAQDQLRALYIEEKRKMQENSWVMNWLNGDKQASEIEHLLANFNPPIKNNGCVVCLGKVASHDEEIDLTYYSMIFSSILEQHGFFSFKSYVHHTMIFVLINQRSVNDWKERLLKAINQRKKITVQGKNGPLIFAAGRLFQDLEKMNRSYKMAQEVLFIKEKNEKDSRVFYEELYIDRLLLQLKKDECQEFISDYIGPVLDYDRAHDEKMLDTLRILLEVNGSKKEAAERLHIVRQTLYHRIDTLKSLLGEDFMEPNKRLAIEVSIKAWKLGNGI